MNWKMKWKNYQTFALKIKIDNYNEIDSKLYKTFKMKRREYYFLGKHVKNGDNCSLCEVIISTHFTPKNDDNSSTQNLRSVSN